MVGNYQAVSMAALTVVFVTTFGSMMAQAKIPKSKCAQGLSCMAVFMKSFNMRLKASSKCRFFKALDRKSVV